MNGAGNHDQADTDHAAPTELDSAFGDRRIYKHGAPNGVCPPLASADACKLQATSPAAPSSVLALLVASWPSGTQGPAAAWPEPPRR